MTDHQDALAQPIRRRTVMNAAWATGFAAAFAPSARAQTHAPDVETTAGRIRGTEAG